MSKMPHDSAMTPSVDPSVSLIPPLNTSSSYYDGIVQSLGSLSRRGGALTTVRFFPDLVYLHMDLNIRVRRSELSTPLDTKSTIL